MYYESESDDSFGFEVTNDAVEVEEENGNSLADGLADNTMDEGMEEGEGDTSDSEDEQDATNENYLKMPERKLKDPAPVWKCTCTWLKMVMTASL